MAKLWQKNVDLDKTMETFTAGEDVELDLHIAQFDVLGSIAHATMLQKVGILTKPELKKLLNALLKIQASIQRGEFTIPTEMEDVHTAVEALLTDDLGDVGKKIHTARSRNDQVALDCRMFARARLLELRSEVLALARQLVSHAEKHFDVPVVGRTHTQRAMPSSVGLWSSSYAEAMIENAELLATIYKLVNRSPLGSAASYGVAVPIDRELTAELLGFDRPIINVLYANNTRGKIEAEILGACAVLMGDLSKASADVIFFSIPETAYFILPERFCPGSSIMPQKKNPGPLELIRARASAVTGHLVNVLGITRGLLSGYNRDFQETKGPMIRGLDTAISCVKVLSMIIAEMRVDVDRCIAAFTPEVFAADEALKMVTRDGVPWRDAYREIGLNLDKLESSDPVENIMSKTHLGAPGNLALDTLTKFADALQKDLDADTTQVTEALEKLESL